jgi:PAS domain S-box-containing protein
VIERAEVDAEARGNVRSAPNRGNGSLGLLRSAHGRSQLLAVVLIPLLMFCATAWWSWIGVRSDAHARVERMTAALAEHAQRVFSVQDVILSAALERVRGSTPGAITANPGVHEFLVTLARSKKPAGSVTLIDPASGHVLVRSEAPTADTNLSDRDYVRAHRDDQATSFISEVSKGRFTGELGFTVSRRDPASGLIAASRLPLSEFQAFYAQLREGERDVLNITREDGALLVRVPPPADPVGIQVSATPIFEQFRRGELPKAVLARSAIDGVARFVHLRKVANYPLQVYYGLDYARIRDRWLGQLVPYGVLSLLATGLLLWLSARTLKATEAQRHALTHSTIADARAKHAEEIASAQLRLAAIIDTTADAVIGVDADARIISWNRAAEALFGYAAAEAIGQSADLLVASMSAPPPGENARGVFDAAIAGNTIRKDTVRAAKDGTVIDVAVTATPITGADGRVVGISTIFRDIRERKHAEERLRSFIKHVPVAIAMFDRNMRYLAASQHWIEEYGLDASTLIGHTNYELFLDLPEAWKDVHRRVMAGETLKADANRFERTGLPTMWLRWEARPWTSVGGTVEGVVLFTENVTARKTAEDRLRVRDERLRLAAELAHIGFSEIDLATMQVRGSPEFFALFELSPSDDWVPAERIRARYHPDDRARIVADITQAIQTGPLAQDRRILLPDGRIRWVHDVSDNRSDKSGKVIARFAATLDITARKLAEEALREREERLRVAAHAASIGFSVFDPSTQRIRGSPEFFELFGLPPTDEAVPAVQIRSRYHPEEQARIEADVERSVRTGAPLVQDRRIILPSGQIRWVHIVSETRRDAAGNPLARFAATIDITDRKRREEQVQLLLREVDHRGRNLLQLVQAVAMQTAGTTTEEFLPRFLDRIQALAASQDLLVKSAWRGVLVEDLVRLQLGHFEDLLDHRIELQGPPLKLSPPAAQSIGMALHELSTNAGKYGALANGTGRVAITWQLEQRDGGDRFCLSWDESGGPPVPAPTRRGFGSTVIGVGPRMDLEADVLLDYAPTGLVWRLACPAANALDSATQEAKDQEEVQSDAARLRTGDAA